MISIHILACQLYLFLNTSNTPQKLNTYKPTFVQLIKKNLITELKNYIKAATLENYRSSQFCSPLDQMKQILFKVRTIPEYVKYFK